MLIMEHFECTKEEAENLADIVTDINFKGYKLPFIDIRTKQNIDDLNLEEKTKEYLREYIDSGRYIKYINDKTRLYSNNNVHNLKIEFEKIIELHPDYSQEKIVTDMKKALEEGTNSVLYSSNNGNDRKMIKEDLDLIVSLFLRQKNNNNLSEIDIIKQLSVSGITADITTYINSKNKLLAKKSKDDPTKYTMPDQTKNKTVMKDLNQRRESIETALIPSGLIEDYNYKIEEKTYRTEKYRRYISKQKEKIDRIKLMTDGRIITPDQEEAVKEESLNKIIEEHKYMFPNGTDHCITEHSEVLGTNHKLCSSTMLLNNGLKFKVRILIAHTAVVFGLANATPNSPTLGHLIYKKTISDDLDPSSISGELNRFVGELKVNKDELFVLFGTEKAEDYMDGYFENNSNYDNAEDLYHHLLDKWKFCWIVDKAKVNGTEEFEDYEPSLTKEQRTERDKALAHFEEAFRQIQTE